MKIQPQNQFPNPQLSIQSKLTEVGIILSSAILRLKAREIASNNLTISNNNAFLANNNSFPLDSFPVQSVHRDGLETNCQRQFL